MKRSLIPALIAMAALVVGLSNASALAGGEAQSAAKPGKGKSKGCKKKAGKSAVSAKPGKKKGCGKGKATGGALPTGSYWDEAHGVTLFVSSGRALLTYRAEGFCVPIDASSPSFPLKDKGSSVSGNGTTVIRPGGVPVSYSWSISIDKANLNYTLEIDMRSQDPAFAHCKLSEKVSGALRSPGTASAFATLATTQVKPVSGEWRFDGSPQPVVETFTVTDGGSQKIKNFKHSGIDCTYTVPKAIPIKGNGKFTYQGGATLLGGKAVSIKIAGEFVGRKKAKYVANPEAESCGDRNPKVIAEPVGD